MGWLFLLSASSYSGPRGDKGGVVIKWFLRVAVTRLGDICGSGWTWDCIIGLGEGKRKKKKNGGNGEKNGYCVPLR